MSKVNRNTYRTIKVTLMNTNEKRDYQKFFIENGEEGFSPEYNAWVVENSIRKSDIERAKRLKEHREAVAERSEAVISYLKSKFVRGTSPVEQYFGKRTLAYLRGEKIKEIAQGNKRILTSID